MRVLICEFMDEAALDDFGPAFRVIYDPTLAGDRPRLLDMLAETDGLIVRTATRVDRELLNAAPKLRVVGRLGVGLDNIDLVACARAGVAVKPARGANAVSVAEYVIACALLLTRGAFDMSAATIAGEWPRRPVGGEVAGRVLGVVGLGDIGRRVVRRACGLGMVAAASDPYLAPNGSAWEGVERLDAPELLAKADIVSLHVPLTEETHGMIDAAAIAGMKDGAILINASRGGVAVDAAVADALKSGKLGGAALDVFESEPLTAEDAAIFDGAPNLILTPHIAGVTPASNLRVSRVTVAEIVKSLGGAPS